MRTIPPVIALCTLALAVTAAPAQAKAKAPPKAKHHVVRSKKKPAPKPVTLHPRGLSTAQWAGTVRSGSTYDHVGGTFTVPTVTPGCGPAALSAVWVGLGGLAPFSPLAQAGISLDSAGNVGVWYELISSGGDQPSVPVPLAVRPGDLLDLELDVSAGAGGPSLTFSWQDLTTGQGAMRTIADARPFLLLPTGSDTADWIVERPDLARPMTAIGPVVWQAATTRTTRGLTVRPADPTSLTRGGPVWLRTAGATGTVSAPSLPPSQQVTVTTSSCGG